LSGRNGPLRVGVLGGADSVVDATYRRPGGSRVERVLPLPELQDWAQMRGPAYLLRTTNSVHCVIKLGFREARYRLVMALTIEAIGFDEPDAREGKIYCRQAKSIRPSF